MEVIAAIKSQIVNEKKRVRRLLNQTRLLHGGFQKALGLTTVRLRAVLSGRPSLEAAFAVGTVPSRERPAEELHELGPDQIPKWYHS
jgi:hypothetical protein